MLFYYVLVFLLSLFLFIYTYEDRINQLSKYGDNKITYIPFES